MIKNLIFDLGGVVINLDRDRAVMALKELGLGQAEILLGEYSQKGPFLQLETGEISSSEFFDLLLPQCKAGTSCSKLRDAFEEFLVDIPAQRLVMLEELRAKGFRMFVLSNTNPVMFNHWIDREFKKSGKSINDYFDGVVTSFQEGVCKPNLKIFQNLVARYNLNPGETLMLDDSQKNVDSAHELGLHVFRITSEGQNSFESVCRRLLDGEDLEKA